MYPYLGHWPTVAADAYVAEGAHLIGDVVLLGKASIWFNTVLRADLAKISVGPRSNVQDNCTIHVDNDYSTLIGEDVTVGHGATLHGCRIEDRVLIGIGAIVLNGATIGAESIVGAHALVTQGKTIPPRSLVLGSPGRVVRIVTDDEVRETLENGRGYVTQAARYLGLRGNP
ncbi:MAG: gamma carbonic anhydrase family protein [Chloroflexi bacterium]|nr:gamma carbonic anhydrase family protein [Chloroflexota bacterium]